MISKNIEYQTMICIKQFVKLLRPIRSGIVTINGREILAEPEVPEQVKTVLKDLTSGHKDDKLRNYHFYFPTHQVNTLPLIRCAPVSS